MGLFFPQLICPDPRRKSLFSLAFCWISGCIAGVFLYAFADPVLSALIHDAVTSPPSLAAAMSAATLPVIFSAAATFCSWAWLVFPVVFLTSFSQSFLSLATLLAFRGGGWIVCALFLFGSIATAPLLWFCWIQAVTSKRIYIARLSAVLLGCSFIGLMDHLFISPFLQKLLF